MTQCKGRIWWGRGEEMNIQSVETKTGLTKRMIRHYEEFGLISPQRGENGYREYTNQDVDSLLCIKAMREVGFSLNEIGSILKDGKTEETLRRHLGNLLIHQQEEIRKQQARIQVIKNALRSDDTNNRLLDRIAATSNPLGNFDGVDNLKDFLQKRHVVRGNINPFSEFYKVASFGSQNEFKIIDVTYTTYGGVFEENIQTRASISLCKELYAYVLLFSDSVDQYGPAFHKRIIEQFSGEWRKISHALTLKFDAFTDDIASLERMFSHFDLAVNIAAEDPVGAKFSLVVPGQPLVVYLSQKEGVAYNTQDWLDDNFSKE